MKDEKYKELEEKYKKKCARVSDLLKQIKHFQERIDRANNHDSYAWKHVNKFRCIEETLGKNYYKVFYKARTKGGAIMSFDETVYCCHPRVAVWEIEQKNYTDFEFTSVEKTL